MWHLEKIKSNLTYVKRGEGHVNNVASMKNLNSIKHYKQPAIIIETFCGNFLSVNKAKFLTM